jgi:flavodoxin I
VRAIVIYESLTGNTRKAAELLAHGLSAEGVTTVASPITQIDYQALSEADLVVVGSWVDGLFVVGQRPGRVGRIADMPALAGKKAVVYLTYALAPGKALQKLSDTVAGRGAEVLGGVTIRRDRIAAGVQDLVAKILDVVTPA